MSDTYLYLSSLCESDDEADILKDTLISIFTSSGIIEGKPSKDHVYGGLGYRPGPAIKSGYDYFVSESPFWHLRTCGVSFETGRSFNESAISTTFDGLTCPECGSLHRDKTTLDEVIESIVSWCGNDDTASARCTSCGLKSPVTRWRCTPELGLGNLTVRFWNWPQFNDTSWRLDLPKIYEDISGLKPTISLGRI